MAGFLLNNYTTAKVLKQLDLFWPKCLLKDAKALSDVAKHLMPGFQFTGSNEVDVECYAIKSNIYWSIDVRSGPGHESVTGNLVRYSERPIPI